MDDAQTISIALTTVGGIVLSLLTAYVPGYSAWFRSLKPIQKRLVFLVSVVLVGVVMFLLSCAAPAAWNIPASCTEAGVWDMIAAISLTFVGSQAMYKVIEPKTID